MSIKRQLLIAVGVIIVAVLIVVVMVKLRKSPKQVEPVKVAPLVEAQKLDVSDITMIISGWGTVRPKVDVEIVPQVSGKIVSVNPEFKAGGFIAANTEIFTIDPRDYELAVQHAQAAVAEAAVQVDTEKAEAEVARQEWYQLNPGIEPASALVLREPQIKRAEAKLESAKAQLETAKLNLERTTVSLPVNVRIESESVDLGQFVTVGKTCGRAYGIKRVEIEVPLEDSELEWFNIPNGRDLFDGKIPDEVTTAEVKADFAGDMHTWQGYVTRTTGMVDEKSRLVHVVVEVPEPFESSSEKPPLIPGMFVKVFIHGKTLKDAVAVPRDSVREGNKIWLVNDNKLNIKEIDIARSDNNYVYVSDGIEDNAVIILSSLDTAVDGMDVRVQFKDSDSHSKSAPQSNDPNAAEGK